MSAKISDTIMDDIKLAMREKNTVALTVLRGLKSAFKYAAIEKHGADGELEEAEVIAVVRKQIKQRQDSVASFQEAGRQDLIDKELEEVGVLENYLPVSLSEGEISELVGAVITELGATSKKEMGAVMKVLQERAAGRADNKVLSKEVMQRLG